MNSDPTAPVVAMTPQQKALVSDKEGALQKYKKLAVGAEASFFQWMYYEVTQTLLSGLPALLGFASRAVFYPALFASCGAKLAIGRGVLLRNTQKITLGKGVMIDDYAVLDVRGNGKIEIGDYVVIGRYTTLVAKDGLLKIESGANIGSYCRIATQSQVVIGSSTLVAAYCYVGPGNHQHGDTETPLIERDMEIKGGVHIAEHAWIGTRSTILDGVVIGAQAIVGAHSLVRESVAAGVTVVGTPAKVMSK